jgi:hypothetical protein
VATPPAICHPRRPRASPLWQIVHRGWDDFVSSDEKKYRPAMGPLRPESVAARTECIAALKQRIDNLK